MRPGDGFSDLARALLCPSPFEQRWASVCGERIRTHSMAPSFTSRSELLRSVAGKHVRLTSCDSFARYCIACAGHVRGRVRQITRSGTCDHGQAEAGTYLVHSLDLDTFG